MAPKVQALIDYVGASPVTQNPDARDVGERTLTVHTDDGPRDLSIDENALPEEYRGALSYLDQQAKPKPL